jgi:hypothetical protein
VGDVISYGGDLRIVATRGEISRVQQQLHLAGAALTGELELTDFIALPLKRIGLALELPAIDSRLQQLLHACQVASDEYLDGDALIAENVIGANLAPVAALGLLSIADRVGLLQETKVSALQTMADTPVRSPQSIEHLVQRLINLDDREGAKIRIEKYPGKFLVYIPGTQVWQPVARANPFDLTSNLSAMTGAGVAASELGVQRALIQAGVTQNDRVLFIGHSQGGLIAANIAANAEKQNYRVAGLITLGAPLGQLATQIKVSTISLEHSNDVVPKLGLKANPIAANWVTVQRELPVDENKNALVQAHELPGYQETARLTDNAQDAAVQRIKSELLNEKSETGITKIFTLRRD